MCVKTSCSYTQYWDVIRRLDCTALLKSVTEEIHDEHTFQAQSQQFLDEDESPDVVETAGEKALVSLYKGKPDESLDSLRHKQFCDKAAVKSSKVQP